MSLSYGIAPLFIATMVATRGVSAGAREDVTFARPDQELQRGDSAHGWSRLGGGRDAADGRTV